MINVYLFFREDSGKGIPYLTGHGFKSIKGDIDAIDTIPEAADHQPYREALRWINDPTTPFFTVGCEKSFNLHEEGALWWAKGYFELCFNHLDLAQNPSNWMPFFQRVSNRVAAMQIDPNVLQIWWEIDRDLLTDVAEGSYVYTAGVWVCVGMLPEKDQIETMWADIWEEITECFSTEPFPESAMPPIYPLA
jgi:hypothetical protein